MIQTKHDYGRAMRMSANERTISFLNNYFIYKKVRSVDADAISMYSMKSTLTKNLVSSKKLIEQEKLWRQHWYHAQN